MNSSTLTRATNNFNAKGIKTMRKFLCYSHEDYVAKMVKIFDDSTNTSPEDVESFLGVEFAMRDEHGKTAFISDVSKNAQENPSDIDAQDWFAYWENQIVASDIFRINSPQELPAKYPAIVLTAIEDDWDRTGSMSTRVVEFVYESDFNPKAGVV
jgi:hypothetical protein